ncbi:MAG: large conductance mechanosensitive channel protein MscL [Actinomycetaceae bacterium]|nr:large conductance mechanosensitive channel protein MscL [Actinomycetaceae bacterium]
MLKGFKEFIMRGNVIDLAVGVIIGGAFAPIVTALTDNIIMPIIAGIFGQPSFDDVLAFEVGGSAVQPGIMISAIINFLLIAAALYFCIVLPMNRLAARRASGEEEAEELSAEAQLLTEIRDSLRYQGGYPGTHQGGHRL